MTVSSLPDKRGERLLSRHLFVVLCAVALLTGCREHSETSIQKSAVFYVSTCGNDDWSGRLAEPAEDGSDGPFASLVRARDAVRLAMTSRDVPCSYKVLIRGGRYILEEPVVFNPEDSALEESTVTYAAWPDEKPVFSGGYPVTDWERSPDGITLTARVPEVRVGEWYATGLFVNGRRAVRARTPDEGCLRTAGKPVFSPTLRQRLSGRTLGRRGKIVGDNLDRMGMQFEAGDITAFENLEDVNLHIMHAWTGAIHWIEQIDAANRSVLFSGPGRFPVSTFEPRMPYFIENVKSVLDDPGEWYLDRKTGVLTYYPREGEDLRSADTLLTRLQTLIRFEGDAGREQYVEQLVFDGLAFEHADWAPLDREKENDGFSGTHFLRASIEARALKKSVFKRCEISRGGGYGMYLIDGSVSNRVVQCEINDMGGGGILIGSRWSPYDIFPNEIPPADAPVHWLSRYNTVENCFVHDTGMVFPGTVGVMIAHGPYNRVVHNEICNLPYSGVVVGRILTDDPSHAHHNEVAWNHIHHLGRGLMSDMAGVYTEGVSPGTRIHHNLIHDVNRYRYGAWGLYCDQASRGILLENNIVYECMDGGYMQNIGTENTIRNNIFGPGSQNGQISSGFKRNANSTSDHMTVVRNVIVTETGDLLARYWYADDAFRFDRNLYWAVDSKALKFGKWTWDEWRDEMRQDTHSRIADPLFVDPDEGDYRLRPDSPAFSLGFSPLDLAGAGLYGDTEWVACPGRYPAQVFSRAVRPLKSPTKQIGTAPVAAEEGG